MSDRTPELPARLVLATRNPGKIREILQICASWPVGWLTAADPGGAVWPDVEETGATYSDNAGLKARAAARATGLPALADDSGIEQLVEFQRATLAGV